MEVLYNFLAQLVPVFSTAILTKCQLVQIVALINFDQGPNLSRHLA